MDEEYIFYLAMERALPQMLFGADITDRLAAIEAALQATGTEIGRSRTTPKSFAAAFEAIGEELGVGRLLAQGAVAASPHDLLPDHDLSWRMGFFGAQTVELVQQQIAASLINVPNLDLAPSAIQQIRDLFLAACEEATATGQSIVIIHGDV